MSFDLNDTLIEDGELTKGESFRGGSPLFRVLCDLTTLPLTPCPWDTHVYIDTHTYTHMFIHVTHTCTQTHEYIRTYSHTFHTRTHIHRHPHTYVCTRIHFYVHT